MNAAGIACMVWFGMGSGLVGLIVRQILEDR